MLRSIHVSGFRSLLDCSIDVQPGINILVGPNGSGKTNILMFLEFVSAIFENSVNEAVNQFGGAENVFSKSGDEVSSKTITAKMSGSGAYPNPIVEKGQEKYFLQYEYEFSIAFSDALETAYFKRQDFKLRVAPSSENLSRKNVEGIWDAHVTQSASIEDKEPQYVYRADIFDHVMFTTPIMNAIPHANEKDMKEFIELLLENPAMNFGSPIPMKFPFVAIEAIGVLEDFIHNKILNVIPSIAKMSEYSTAQPGIREDGGGLTSTLYALCNKENKFNSPPKHDPFMNLIRQTASRPRFSPIPFAFHEIECNLQLLNEEIISLEVNKDSLSGLLTAFLTMNSKRTTFKLPLSTVSDGTIKWLTLVTALLSNRTIFAIEEPENFIHPLMQDEILKLIREVFSSRNENEGADGYMFISTHSQTLLDSAYPSEIVIVILESGATRTYRPQNIDKIRDVIRKSGFGLGHVYLSGVLDDA